MRKQQKKKLKAVFFSFFLVGVFFISAKKKYVFVCIIYCFVLLSRIVLAGGRMGNSGGRAFVGSMILPGELGSNSSFM